MESRVEDLEVRLTYQEAALEELNQVVIKQQNQIDLLIAELQRTKQQLENGSEFVRSQSDEEPPPHY
ncbi:SlyX family protein [Pseudomonadota bacterium]